MPVPGCSIYRRTSYANVWCRREYKRCKRMSGARARLKLIDEGDNVSPETVLALSCNFTALPNL